MSISKRKMKNGKTKWIARHRDANGKHLAVTCDTKSQALKAENEMKNAIARGTWLDPELGKMTLAQVNEKFMATKTHLKPKTISDLNSHWNYHISKKFGKVRISQITTQAIRDWLTESTSGNKSYTSVCRINKAVKQLSQLLDFAVDSSFIQKNPARGSNGNVIKLQKSKSEPVRPAHPVSVDEIVSIAKNAGMYQGMILTIGALGMRWAEIVGIQVQDFDPENNSITVCRSLSEDGGNFYETTTKTGNTRVIYLPNFLIQYFNKYVEGKNPTDLIFCTPSGKPWRNSNFKRDVFNPAVKQAGISHRTVQDLRHSSISNAMYQRITPVDVANMAGHTDSSITLRVYSHASDESKREVAKILDDVFTSAS